jgi:hypothetical protein
VLKLHWLDRKRQCWIDHVIVMLMKGMVPYYEHRHSRQIDSLNRKDLIAECRQELLEHTVKIPSESI